MTMAIAAQSFSLSDYYLTSVRVGLQSLIGPYPRESLARVLNPLSYPRFMEYQLAFELLGPLRDCRVLDIGSPKLPALLLASSTACELHVTDIRDYFIGPTAHFLDRMGLRHRVGSDVNGVHLGVQDARRLTYEDDSFDRVFSISVVEHIPDDGDSAAMAEIARVLRPGGAVALTVPFSAHAYKEDYVRGPIYERQGDRGPNFYQRHYDVAALQSRLVQPSGLTLERIEYFGEPGLRFEKYWNVIPLLWKLPFAWAGPFLAQLFLKRLGVGQIEAACGAALRLRKPSR